MTKVIIAVLLALGVAWGATAHSPKVSQKAISERTTFTLEFEDSHCSGTAISANVILSAAHCFPTDEAISFKVDGRDAKVIKIARDGKDHILVKVNIGLHYKAKLSKGQLEKGDRVYYFGNPGTPDIFRSGEYSGTHEGALVFDINSWQGDSGSAVFNEQGEIVAVVNAMMRIDIFKLTICYPLEFTKEQYESMGVS